MVRSDDLTARDLGAVTLVAMASTPPTDRTRAVQLGRELREAREAAGLSTHDVARALDRSQSTVSRWETARTRPTEADVAAMLTVLGVTSIERDRLVELVRHEGVNDWVAPGIDRQLALLIEYEQVAEVITEVNLNLVPGLVQTEEYARSLMLSHGMPLGQAKQSTMVRMGRQRTLTRVKPPTFVALVGEQALRYPACSREIMRDQLKYLHEFARRPNVIIRILPLKVEGFTLALEGRFVLLEFQRESPIVQVEGFWHTSTLTNPRAAEKYRVAAESIRDDALNEEDSAEMLRDLVKDME